MSSGGCLELPVCIDPDNRQDIWVGFEVDGVAGVPMVVIHGKKCDVDT
ncbi:MAG: hypothetical protein Ct9H300mP27_05420 [Chloroflexota bacterium]|nr:MAG: hypothetical protein Ct9H300mP27_05420 [Chloroflexota bacterium]